MTAANPLEATKRPPGRGPQTCYGQASGAGDQQVTTAGQATDAQAADTPASPTNPGHAALGGRGGLRSEQPNDRHTEGPMDTHPPTEWERLISENKALREANEKLLEGMQGHQLAYMAFRLRDAERKLVDLGARVGSIETTNTHLLEDGRKLTDTLKRASNAHAVLRQRVDAMEGGKHGPG